LDSVVEETTCMIPVLGMLTYSRFELADRLLASIDYPIEDLVIVDNSGKQQYVPVKPEMVKRMWLIQVPYGLGYGGGLNLIVKSTPFAPYWVLLNDDSVLAPGALQKISEEVDPQTINFLSIMPKWSGFVLGEKVVKDVGLFDERFHPIYFEDNDYERRIINAGFEAKFIHATLAHDNSSTIGGGFHSQNSETFSKNNALYLHKVATNDFSEGVWSLQIRRDNSWE
jgi:GT2 family glycosyltransferase